MHYLYVNSINLLLFLFAWNKYVCNIYFCTILVWYIKMIILQNNKVIYLRKINKNLINSTLEYVYQTQGNWNIGIVNYYWPLICTVAITFGAFSCREVNLPGTLYNKHTPNKFFPNILPNIYSSRINVMKVHDTYHIYQTYMILIQYLLSMHYEGFMDGWFLIFTFLFVFGNKLLSRKNSVFSLL